MNEYVITYKLKGKVSEITITAGNAMLASDKALIEVHKRMKIISIERK